MPHLIRTITAYMKLNDIEIRDDQNETYTNTNRTHSKIFGQKYYQVIIHFKSKPESTKTKLHFFHFYNLFIINANFFYYDVDNVKSYWCVKCQDHLFLRRLSTKFTDRLTTDDFLQ